jgi:hypothetical protein
MRAEFYKTTSEKSYSKDPVSYGYTIPYYVQTLIEILKYQF